MRRSLPIAWVRSDVGTHLLSLHPSTALIDRLPPLPRTDLAGPSAAAAGEATQVLILVSSIELALQAARTVTRAYPELHVEIEQGSKYKATGLADVTVATVQTLSRGRSSAATGGAGEERLDKFDPRRFKAVIVSGRKSLT